MIATSAQAYTTGDDYPYKYECAGCHATWWGHDHTDSSKYGFFFRQCTDFAAWCLNSRNGIAFRNNYQGLTWGDAKNWGNAARQLGIPVDSHPAVGAVAWWGGGDYGHVAWVSAVDGNNVTIEEYNHGSNPCGYHTDTLPRRTNPWTYDDPPTGYIHIKDIGSPSQPEPSQPPAPSLPAQDIGDNFYAYIYNPQSNCNLENRNGNVQTASVSSADPRQIWHFIRQDRGLYKIKNMYDGQCLDAVNWGSQNGANIGAGDDNDTTAQRWWLCGKANENQYYIHPPYLPEQDFVIDVSDGSTLPGANVQLYQNWYKENGGTFNEERIRSQTFKINKISNVATILPSNIGTNFSARISYNGCYLKTSTILTENGNNRDIQITKTENVADPKQIWHFSRQSDGSYTIVNEYSDYYMDVPGAEVYDKARVRTWIDDSSVSTRAGRRWYVMSSPGDSTYRLVSSVKFPSELFSLDVPEGNTAEGTTMELFRQQWGENQQFNITKLSYTKPAKPAAPTNIQVNATSSGTTITRDIVPTVGMYDNRAYRVYLASITENQVLIPHTVVNGTNYTSSIVLPNGKYEVLLQSVNTKYANLLSGFAVYDFSVSPEPVTHTVSVNTTDGGTAKGGGTYKQGVSATVIATPNVGYKFVAWKENGSVVSTDATYTFTANAGRTLVAVFEKEAVTPPSPQKYITNLMVSPLEGGTATGAGSRLEGEPITLTATPRAGYVFKCWRWSDGTSSENPYTFTVRRTQTVTAVFEKTEIPEPLPENYTITVNAEGGGSVSGGGSYKEGVSATVTAMPDDGYKFVGWMENDGLISTEDSYTFTVTSNRTLTAVFEKAGTTVPDPGESGEDPAEEPDAITGAVLNRTSQTVRVGLRNQTAGILVAAVYSNKNQLVEAVLTPVSADCGEAELKLTRLPGGCKIKLMLTDESAWKPMCKPYEIF